MKVLPMPTTDQTLAFDLKRSLIAQGVAVDAGDTWGEFKAAVEKLGITDDTRLSFIEYGVAKYGLGHIEKDTDHDPDDPNAGVGIREL